MRVEGSGMEWKGVEGKKGGREWKGVEGSAMNCLKVNITILCYRIALYHQLQIS